MDKIANRRLKLFLIWLVSCFIMIALQPILKWDISLVQSYLDRSGMAMIIVVGGLSATDAVSSFAGMKK